MLRWIVAGSLALIAAPSQAAVRLEEASAYYQTVFSGEDIVPGLGTFSRNFGFTDIGGCEGSDVSGEPCGSGESGSWSVTLTNSGLTYAAAFSQQDASVTYDPDTYINLYAIFRADRQMRIKTRETRIADVSRCERTCSNFFASFRRQDQLPDGSWQVVVSFITAATTSEAAQSIDHRIAMTFAEVPEPHNWVLMIAGFGLVGAAARQARRRAPAATARR
jgi:hypothetical protein